MGELTGPGGGARTRPRARRRAHKTNDSGEPLPSLGCACARRRPDGELSLVSEIIRKIKCTGLETVASWDALVHAGPGGPS